jgi:GT2 family glycosyltransferase
MSGTLSDIGVVVIGRNEGERLKRCLRSVNPAVGALVYVDSGSTDGSAEFAHSLPCTVVLLDMAVPFTAARARNAGAEALPTHSIRFIQFIDGDCELRDTWLTAARAALLADSRRVIVAGRLRERHPDASLYNRLCDLEWDQPAGETDWCGGIFMVRANAFVAAGRFNPTIAAGEEPELCGRLRAAGGTILRLRDEMAWHDAAMARFGQWWLRAKRSGNAAARAALRRDDGAPPWRNHRLRAILLWGLVGPAAFLAAVTAALLQPGDRTGWFLLGGIVILLYFLQTARIHARRRISHGGAFAGQYALFCMLAKFAEAQGAIRALWRSLAGRSDSIIEYKGSTPAATTPSAGAAARPANQAAQT